jgi:putative transposase
MTNLRRGESCPGEHIDTVRTTQRSVKYWSSGEMGLRWTAAGMLEAEKQFRRVIGYSDLPRLALASERRLHLHQANPAMTQEDAVAVTV